MDDSSESFWTVQEFPAVRYRAAKSLDASTMTTLRDLIPTKLAAGIWNCLAKHKQSIENFPQTETCELLILDRSIDQVYNCLCGFEWSGSFLCFLLIKIASIYLCRSCFLLYICYMISSIYLFWMSRLPLLYMSGLMMLCAMIYWICKGTNMYMW